MYSINVNGTNYDLSTSFRTIDKIQKRTKKSLNELAVRLDAIKLEDCFELLADGLGEGTNRAMFINECKENLAPVLAYDAALEFITEINFNGMTEEQREEQKRKNYQRLMEASQFN